MKSSLWWAPPWCDYCLPGWRGIRIRRRLFITLVARGFWFRESLLNHAAGRLIKVCLCVMPSAGKVLNVLNLKSRNDFCRFIFSFLFPQKRDFHISLSLNLSFSFSNKKQNFNASEENIKQFLYVIMHVWIQNHFFEHWYNCLDTIAIKRSVCLATK